MKKRFTFLIAAIMAIIMMVLPGKAVGQTQTTVSISSFSATSGTIDSHISYAAYKGNGTTNPATSSNTLRIYKPDTNQTDGGYVAITAATNYELNSVTITNSNDKAGTIKYSIDGGSLSSAISLAKQASYTVNNLTASSISFYNCGTDRLSIAGFSVTYTSSGTTPTTYTVTYKANNGSATADVTESVSSGGSTTLKPSNTFTFDGHTFYRWNTAANGSGTDYEAGAALNNVTSAYTFYARWNYNVAIGTVTGTTITATYNNNNLSGNTNAVPRGAQISLAHGELAANQEFEWSIVDEDDNDITSTVLSGTTLTLPDKNITISGSVITVDPTFTINFANGGNCSSTSATFTSTNGLPTGTSITMSTAQNGSQNAPAYNSNNHQLRLYYGQNGNGNGCSVTLTPSGMTITKVVIASALTPNVSYRTKANNQWSSWTSCTWSSSTITVSNLSVGEAIEFKNVHTSESTQLQITSIVVSYQVNESFTPTVNLNNNYGTLSDPTENVYTVTPNTGYKITGFTKSDNVTVEKLTGDAFSASTYRIIASAANQTVTFNLEARENTTVKLYDGVGGSSTTEIETYKDATLGSAVANHTIASVNGWNAYGWVKSYTSGVPSLIDESELIGNTTELHAAYKKGSNRFDLITSTNALENNGVYMICYNSSTTYKFMNGVDANNTNYMGCTDANSVSNNSFEYVAGEKFTLGGNSTDGYTLADGNNYLSATSGQNYLGLVASASDDYAKWGITFADSKALIANKGITSNNLVSFYYSNNYFNLYSSQNAYLFKQMTNNAQYTTAPDADKCSLTYNANGGEGDDFVDDNGGVGYEAGTKVTVKDNDGVGNPNFTKEGHSFSNWKDIITNESYALGNEITLDANTTLYAQWTVNSYDWSKDLTNAVSGTTAQLKVDNAVVPDGAKIEYGTEVTVVVTVPDGYLYSISVNNGSVSVSNNKFTMPGTNVSVVVTTEVNPYVQVSLTSTEMDDMQGVLAYGNKKTVTVGGLTWETNGQQESTRTYIQIRARSGNNEISYVKLPDLNGKIETIALSVANGSGNAWSNTVYFNDAVTNNNNDYIVSVKGSSSTSVTLDLSSKFYSTGYLLANGPTRLLSITITYRPYQDMTGTELPTAIAADRTISIPASTNATATTLTIPASSGVIIKSGASLTVSGTLSVGEGGTANNIVVEDGGQLILSNNTSVQATVQKEITKTVFPSTKDGEAPSGWYSISSSVNPTTILTNTNLVTESAFDLYYYNETVGTMQWVNYHQANSQTGFTTMDRGRGYLYRNANNVTIEFTGTVNTGNITYNVTKSDVGTLSGFNLIGNPFTHDIYKGEDQNIDESILNTGFYVATNSGSWEACADGDKIEKNQGVLVQANTEGQITIKNTVEAEAKGGDRANRDNIKFVVANSQYEDVAYAMFDKGNGLNKISHRNAEIPMLYIPQNDENYAIAMMDDNAPAFNLNFKAMTMGQYTLSYKTQGEFNYLHVIDRLTGEDVDMLIEGEYNFIGSPQDNEARFIVRLGYLPNYDNNGEDIFAYQNGSDIIVSGEGELQIFDVMGRMVSTQNVSGTEKISVNAQGVYIFRLVGTEIKTQKIVVK